MTVVYLLLWVTVGVIPLLHIMVMEKGKKNIGKGDIVSSVILGTFLGFGSILMWALTVIEKRRRK